MRFFFSNSLCIACVSNKYSHASYRHSNEAPWCNRSGGGSATPTASNATTCAFVAQSPAAIKAATTSAFGAQAPAAINNTTSAFVAHSPAAIKATSIAFASEAKAFDGSGAPHCIPQSRCSFEPGVLRFRRRLFEFGDEQGVLRFRRRFFEFRDEQLKHAERA